MCSGSELQIIGAARENERLPLVERPTGRKSRSSGLRDRKPETIHEKKFRNSDNSLNVLIVMSWAGFEICNQRILYN